MRVNETEVVDLSDGSECDEIEIEPEPLKRTWRQADGFVDVAILPFCNPNPLI